MTESNSVEMEVMTMPMKPERRAFLLKVLGPERLAALERELPRMEAALMAAGIGWKETAALAGALTWADADRMVLVAETLDLTDTFTALVANVMDDADLTTEQKAQLVGQAADGLKKRVDDVGQGEKSAASNSPARVDYVQDLLAAGGRKTVDAVAVKELEESGAPAGGLVAALLQDGPVRG